MKNLFEKSLPGRRTYSPGRAGADSLAHLPGNLLAARPPALCELSELDVIRHFTRLSQKNTSVDNSFYPLGSCTMKYNPRVNEAAAAIPAFSGTHPWHACIDEGAVQGSLEVIYHLSALLCEITGMSSFTTQPYAGAHGELLGVFIAKAYHRARGDERKYIIVPESAHGTNPASAAMGGYSVITVPVDSRGGMDLSVFKEKISSEVAAVMMTLPSTLGVFESDISAIAAIAHEHGALLYYDGANLNAIIGRLRPGDAGFDIVHLNLHKSFSTPHGGGGPGAGAVGVSRPLTDFLPVPLVRRASDGTYYNDFEVKNSIGRIASFYGNFGVLIRAYTYILMLGREGLINVSEMAVLNANYVQAELKPWYDLAYDRLCMHECVFSAGRQAKNGVHALDIAKALIDRGIHPPTIYFPLVVDEAIMIEPTETESKETIDEFIGAMIDIARMAQSDPEQIKRSPMTTEICRPDETKAARELKIIFPEKS